MKLLVTPDYDLSDIWHFNYPLKQLLSESLKQGQFPLWTDMIGIGFPIAAEGQIGAFSPINWIIFGVLPMPLAFMIALVSTFLITGVGMYFFAKTLGLSRSVSLVAASFSTVNGYFIAQMTHLNLLQSFMFIPWAFYFFERYAKEKRLKHLLWLSMIFAQMVLVGYPQTMVNTLLMLFIYCFVRPTRTFLRLIVPIGVSALFAVLLSAVQIVPLVELSRESDTMAVAARQRFVHPLLPSHLFNLIHPFLFGNPSLGTYPFRGAGQPVFWENLLYIGLFPLLIIILTVVVKGIRRKQKRSFQATGLVVVTFVSLLLSLGKLTPIGFLFKIFPLSATRVESRFLVFTQFGLAMLSAIALSRMAAISKRRGIIVGIAAIHVTQVLWVFRTYHAFGNAQEWLSPPDVAEQLPESARIVTLHQENVWGEFSPDKEGWTGKDRSLLDARSTLGANSNIIFGIRQLGVYAQQYPRRQRLIQLNLYRDDALGTHIRQVFGVTHLADAEDGNARVVPLSWTIPDVFEPSVLTRVSGPEEALGRMAQDSFQPGAEALWESDRLPREDENVVVINRSFYPGWKAYLENKKIPIYPVNINQQAVIVPKDASPSTLSFRYEPLSYKIGGAVSVISLIGWIIVVRYWGR